MNYNINHTFRNGLLAIATLAGLYSCSDTWDEHYDGNASGLSYNGTTMQAIQEKTPNFAKVLKAAGYDRELSSENVYTVWAPEIDDATANAYIEQINNGKKDLVIKKFIQSHVARFNHSVTNTPDMLILANTKLVQLGNAADPKFGEAEIKQSNISCQNGVLHIIDRVNPFINNIYELIEELQSESPLEHTLYTFLNENDSARLDESRSVSRGVDENGNPIYVDSVTERYHLPLMSAQALIYEEDSNYTAIIPSPEAYQRRYEYAMSLLKYNKSIVDKAKEGTADSLSNYYANMFAMRDLYYNNNVQYAPEDSITSTVYSAYNWEENVYYKPSTGILAPENYTQKVQCSNGVAYVMDEYPMSATQQFFRRVKLMPRYSDLYISTETFATKQQSESMLRPTRTYLPHTMKINLDENGKPVIEQDEEGNDKPIAIDTVKIADKVSTMTFLACEPKSQTGAPNYTFSISNTMSGTYEVQVVLIPYWLTEENDEFVNTAYKFQTTIYERTEDGKTAGEYDTKGTLLVPTDNHLDGTNYALSKNYREDGTLIYNDTISLGEYTFTNSYYGQNEGGVVIQFKPNGTSKQIREKELTKSMNIAAIILKPKENGEALETK